MIAERLLLFTAKAARGSTFCISAAVSGTPLRSMLTGAYNWSQPSFGLFSTASQSSTPPSTATETQRRERPQQVHTVKQLLRKEREKLRPEQRLEQAARDQGLLDYLERAIDLESPSKMSMQSEQSPSHPDGPLYSDWRPRRGAQLPELVDEVFAEAMESMDGNEEFDTDTIITAGELCRLGAAVHQDEADLTQAVGKLLRSYLEGDNAVTIATGFADEATPDWALGDSHKHPSNLFLVLEVQSGIDGCTDPQFQGASYYLHFWRQRATTNAFRKTCCPAFLLEVLGPHVRLSALSWLDRVTAFPLTPLLNLLPAHPDTDRLLMPVARMLAALRTGLRKLAGTHAASVHAPCTAWVHAQVPWPIRKNPRYDAATAVQLATQNPTYYVRRADSDGGYGCCVVVKLCRKYGLAAHNAWADLKLAPKILHQERLPAGWELLEMEWLPSSQWQPLSMLGVQELNGALVAVKQALKVAHKETGMVHGDVRPPNCLVRRVATGTSWPESWQVRFVDFEWAGREGEATYPAFLNPQIPWPLGVRYGAQLKCEHDLELLNSCTADLFGGDRHGAAAQ